MNKKIIWITGASSGIGEATARKFAKEGWNRSVSARRVELLEKLSSDENIFSYPLDVTDQIQTKQVFEKIINDHKQIDLCIFSSGTYERKSEKELDVQNIRHVIEVNFLGVINCVSAVEKYYKDKNNGHIAIVSSPVGYRGLPKSSGYTPSKAALNNFTQGIYFDFKKFNVKVSLITPGFIKTALTDKNDFKMPFLKDTTYAANEIYNGLVNKNNFEIIFPLPIKIIYKLIQILPNRLYNYLISKSVNR
jgi:short-subunit dehydrogenase